MCRCRGGPHDPIRKRITGGESCHHPNGDKKGRHPRAAKRLRWGSLGYGRDRQVAVVLCGYPQEGWFPVGRWCDGCLGRKRQKRIT